MGLFDTFNAMVDMVNTIVEAGKKMYRIQELVNEIMESADKFTDEYALTEEDAALYDAWVAVYNESVDAEGEEKSKKRKRKGAPLLKFPERRAHYYVIKFFKLKYSQ